MLTFFDAFNPTFIVKNDEPVTNEIDIRTRSSTNSDLYIFQIPRNLIFFLELKYRLLEVHHWPWYLPHLISLLLIPNVVQVKFLPP